MNNQIKASVAIVAFLFTLSSPSARASACEDSPEALNGYMQRILDEAGKTKDPVKLQKEIAWPFTCLLKIYRDSSGFTKYLAGTCLRPLVGGPEIAEIKKDDRHKKLLKHLVEQALGTDPLLDPTNDPLLKTYSSGRWQEYLPFCRDHASQEYCLILFPDAPAILKEEEFLGASSMMLLREAFQKFEGAPKEQIARQLKKLYREVPKNEKLKRRVIDQIHQELFAPPLKLGNA